MGVSVVSALSEILTVNIERADDPNVYQISFKNGLISKKLSKISKTQKKSHGTTITFKPNQTYFDSDIIDLNRLHKLLEAKSILKPGLKIKIIDLKYRKEEKVYCHSGSLDAYLKNSLEGIDYYQSNLF